MNLCVGLLACERGWSSNSSQSEKCNGFVYGPTHIYIYLHISINILGPPVPRASRASASPGPDCQPVRRKNKVGFTHRFQDDICIHF